MTKESLKNYIRLLESENLMLEEYIDYTKFSPSCHCASSIIQKPAKFRLYNDQIYCFVLFDGTIDNDRFYAHSSLGFYRYNSGNCFKTEEEITPEIKRAILEEMKGQWKANEPK